MRTRLLLMVVAVLMTTPVRVNAFGVSINDVQIVPEQPSLNDIITIEVSGGYPQMGLGFDESIFNQNAFSLELDLFFTEGIGPAVPTEWSHDEVIGMLLPGTYDLLVQAYWRSTPDYEYILHDTYPVDMVVVPEPATFTLLGFGLFWALKKHRMSKK